MRIAGAFALLAVVSAAHAHDAPSPKDTDCVIRLGPNDRVARDSTLVVKDGEEVDSAVAIHGDVVIRRGGRAAKAVALGGDVTVEGGAVVDQDAVAIGGDVSVETGARVGKNAVALGGRVRTARGSTVAGGVLGLSLQLGRDLQSRILSELKAEGASCRIERDLD